jgi:hypothetical protein
MCGFAPVFEGGFGKRVCFVVVFLWLICGDRVANRGELMVTFQRLKTCQLSEIHFRRVPKRGICHRRHDANSVYRRYRHLATFSQE